MARPHLVKLWKSGGVLTRPTHAILGPMQLNFLSGPGKALWLATRHEESRRKLCLYALAHGVDASRLAFAERLPRVEDYLARYRQADLFLDTYLYNAHHGGQPPYGRPAVADIRGQCISLARGGQPAALGRAAGHCDGLT